MVKEDFVTPRDLVINRNNYEARQLSQKIIGKYGQLLNWWTEIISATKHLKLQNIQPAQLIQ